MRPDQRKFVERSRERRIAHGEKRRKKILIFLAKAPATQQEIAKLCKCTRPTVRWHLRALMDDKRIAVAGFRRNPKTGKDHFLYSIQRVR